VNVTDIVDVSETILKLKYDDSLATLLEMEVSDGVEVYQSSTGYIILKLTVPANIDEMPLVKLRMKAAKGVALLDYLFLDAETEASIIKNFGTISIFTTGDVNLDGIVSAADVTMLAKHLARFETIINETSKRTADTNSDGAVTAADLTRLAQYIAKLISSFENVG
jgi:hypothetical protein